MNETLNKIVISAVALGAFSILGLGLVALISSATADKISMNERQSLLQGLKQLVPENLYDNDIVADQILVKDLNSHVKTPSAIYRARKNGQPVAAVITAIAPDGYNGDIKLLVGILEDGTLSGVRVVGHKETPGLGDKIESSRSDWILSFSGKSLINLTDQEWAVKRDGGVFDQFAGATITPRAVVNKVKLTLQYFKQNKEKIFSLSETAGKD
ncbi:electron transport complex subunit RsxG [Methylicorpusculum sp.]|uniref:electron transport complex subunit RsxG n=1 Tax=Methylicorpusculum sp. TaxID=2713644 RepID=UPI00273160A8|nr:electron transport complex subunit RsxG [Methylicorpusculum sp.]MDP2179825.1 electron transport complex subunit RsxG [Methylicorpusculum sp.]MDP3528512.1 electron transport complex subunit RsxG [Methylicorpusculum sp.]MDZ4149863.1 electron transport complex subunit RsxG [Methylicorpusculum sp.]